MDNSINRILGIPKSVCDWDFLDLSFPPIQTPRFMHQIHPGDPMRDLIMRSMPKMDYHWLKGREIPVQAEEKGVGKFKSPTWRWINKKYALETSRLVEDWDSSFAFCQADLGGGFWIQSTPLDPVNESTDTDRAFYLSFLYQKKGYLDRSDGARRLARYVKHLAEMPQCPYEVVYLRPAGEELLSKYSPHLKALKYKQTKHSTDQLKRIYRRVLKAKKTKMKDGMFKDGYYYRSELFKPIDPKKHKTEFPWPKLLEDG